MTPLTPTLHPTTLAEDPVLAHWAAPYNRPGAQWFTLTYPQATPTDYGYEPGVYTLVVYPNGAARGFEYDVCMFGVVNLPTAIRELTFTKV